MAESHKPSENGEPVVIDHLFVRAQATQAMRQFFRPLTVVFEPMKPGVHKAKARNGRAKGSR